MVRAIRPGKAESDLTPAGKMFGMSAAKYQVRPQNNVDRISNMNTTSYSATNLYPEKKRILGNIELVNGTKLT